MLFGKRKKDASFVLVQSCGTHQVIDHQNVETKVHPSFGLIIGHCRAQFVT